VTETDALDRSLSRNAATAVEAAAEALQRACRSGDIAALPNVDLQRLMAALVNAYAARRAAGDKFPPVDLALDNITPTDLMVTASQLLQAGDLQVFELGMWQSWTGD
jgi:hypothetical protein